MGLLSSIGSFVKDITGPLIGIGGAAIGAVGGNIANQSAAREAEKNRKWQERMDSSRHQREVADLMAAGLNPILSAHNGGSAPSGATAAQTNPYSGVGETLNSATRMGYIDKQKLKIEQQQTNANEMLAYAATNKSNHEADVLREQESLTRQQITNAATDNLIKSYQLNSIMPEQAKLIRNQAFQAMSSAGAYTAQASLDAAREAMIKLDINKRSKSQDIEPDAEYLRVITEGASNSANAVGDVTDAVYNLLPWRRGTKLPSGQRK